MTTLTHAAVSILETAEPASKARLSRETAVAWRRREIANIGSARPPDRAARPERPVLLPPRQVLKRRITRGVQGRIALFHALAHIELNAIDLAWDLVARFADPALPREFFDDWVVVGGEEARHFELLAGRLAELGGAYGELPAHDGLWESAMATAHDLTARLAVVPLVLEARGLDVTPGMIARLRAAEDHCSAELLGIILRDEIRHVAAGRRWFDFACATRGWEPAAAWQRLVRRHFKGVVKPPFNQAARGAAGLPARYYRPLAG